MDGLCFSVGIQPCLNDQVYYRRLHVAVSEARCVEDMWKTTWLIASEVLNVLMSK
jgi:hypothetical protein